ncbi:MAG TPA: MEDS domain-containing protein [Anaeromyxobacter sp.]|nr:MEDS domain-containing protein [Anaeromyxobacter sp.]
MEETSRLGALHAHVAQFYESDDFLSGSVGDHLAAGLRCGRPVLAIATAPHRSSLAQHLAADGIDVDRATRSGQLALLDAADTLERLMVDGCPRWDRFRSVVGGTLAALEGGRGTGMVCAYGEMVDVLWRRGNPGGAARLEEMWNELARTHPFSLLCAYSMSNFADECHEDDIHTVLGAHGWVVPAESWSLAGDADGRLREVVRLQQRAHALEVELDRRRAMEVALRETLAENRRLQEQTRQKNEELAHAVRLAETFVGMLGHDLRNPLNAIAQAAGLVARRAESDAIAKPAVRIVRSAHRMARMIDQILDFTRIRLGRGLPLEPRPIDLAEVCRLATEELEGEAQAPRVRLEARGDVAGTWDADRLAQLASNLVGNALAHGKPGAPVSIVLDGTSRSEVVLEVENAGSIPADLLPGIFEPFTASRQAASAASNGLGLGLHITRQIATAHGGSIDVASSGDGWTRFTVRLPRMPPAKG